MNKKQWFVLIAGILVIAAIVALFFTFQTLQAAVRPSINIDRHASRTDDRNVTLYLVGPESVSEMKISNESTFSQVDWEPYRARKEWQLSYGRGTKRVYVQYRKSNGTIDRATYQDSIYYSIVSNMNVDLIINDDDSETSNRYTQLTLIYSSGVEEVRLSHTNNFNGVAWKPVSKQLAWALTSGSGQKTVYAQFKDGNNLQTQVQDTIYYNEPARTIDERTLLRSQEGTTYFVGRDGLLHPFFSSGVYLTWYDRVQEVVEVSNAKLRDFIIGSAVCARPGTWLVQFPPTPRVYAVEHGCRLKPLYSPVEAYLLYGPRWADRIMKLPFYTESNYFKYDPRVDSIDADAVDADNDGVPRDVEKSYGTSDNTEDSDGDWISDYEEIYFWFTDPANADTDGDSYADGREILAGYSALGTHKLGTVPTNAYQYPAGSVVKNPENDRLYYVDMTHEYRYIGRNARDKRFTTNNLQEQFIITPAFDIELLPISKESIDKENDLIRYPSTLLQNGLPIAL